MFTRKRLLPFIASREWRDDAPFVVKWLKDFIDSLEQKDALAINEKTNWTPVDGSGAGLAFTVTSATITRGLNRAYGHLQITYPVTANGAFASIVGLPIAALNNVACPMICTAAGGYPNALAVSTGFVPLSAAGAVLTNANLSGATIYISFQFDTA